MESNEHDVPDVTYTGDGYAASRLFGLLKGDSEKELSGHDEIGANFSEPELDDQSKLRKKHSSKLGIDHQLPNPLIFVNRDLDLKGTPLRPDKKTHQTTAAKPGSRAADTNRRKSTGDITRSGMGKKRHLSSVTPSQTRSLLHNSTFPAWPHATLATPAKPLVQPARKKVKLSEAISTTTAARSSFNFTKAVPSLASSMQRNSSTSKTSRLARPDDEEMTEDTNEDMGDALVAMSRRDSVAKRQADWLGRLSEEARLRAASEEVHHADDLLSPFTTNRRARSLRRSSRGGVDVIDTDLVKRLLDLRLSRQADYNLLEHSKTRQSLLVRSSFRCVVVSLEEKFPHLLATCTLASQAACSDPDFTLLPRAAHMGGEFVVMLPMERCKGLKLAEPGHLIEIRAPWQCVRDVIICADLCTVVDSSIWLPDSKPACGDSIHDRMASEEALVRLAGVPVGPLNDRDTLAAYAAATPGDCLTICGIVMFVRPGWGNAGLAGASRPLDSLVIMLDESGGILGLEIPLEHCPAWLPVILQVPGRKCRVSNVQLRKPTCFVPCRDELFRMAMLGSAPMRGEHRAHDHSVTCPPRICAVATVSATSSFEWVSLVPTPAWPEPGVAGVNEMSYELTGLASGVELDGRSCSSQATRICLLARVCCIRWLSPSLGMLDVVDVSSVTAVTIRITDSSAILTRLMSSAPRGSTILAFNVFVDADCRLTADSSSSFERVVVVRIGQAVDAMDSHEARLLCSDSTVALVTWRSASSPSTTTIGKGGLPLRHVALPVSQAWAKWLLQVSTPPQAGQPLPPRESSDRDGLFSLEGIVSHVQLSRDLLLGPGCQACLRPKGSQRVRRQPGHSPALSIARLGELCCCGVDGTDMPVVSGLMAVMAGSGMVVHVDPFTARQILTYDASTNADFYGGCFSAAMRNTAVRWSCFRTPHCMEDCVGECWTSCWTG